MLHNHNLLCIFFSHIWLVKKLSIATPFVYILAIQTKKYRYKISRLVKPMNTYNKNSSFRHYPSEKTTYGRCSNTMRIIEKAMFDRHVGAHNGLAVSFLRHRITGDSFSGRDTGLVGTFDRLSGGDTVLSVWFLREKITGNRGIFVGIYRLRGYFWVITLAKRMVL